MVYMFLGTGFEESEAIVPLDLMRRAGIPVLTVGLNGKTVVSSHGVGICADISIDQLDLTDAEMIVLPGGKAGVASIRGCQPALDAVRFAWDNGKKVAAICAAPTILAGLGITAGRNATCYPGFESEMGTANMVSGAACVTDGNLITGTSAGCSIPFGLALIEALRGKEQAEAVQKQIVMR